MIVFVHIVLRMVVRVSLNLPVVTVHVVCTMVDINITVLVRVSYDWIHLRSQFKIIFVQNRSQIRFKSKA